ncbi:MAG: hypothetical protein AB7O97_23315 [Planctomycetota bacterium]
MRLWNIRALKEDVLRGHTPRQSRDYLIAWFLLPIAVGVLMISITWLALQWADAPPTPPPPAYPNFSNAMFAETIGQSLLLGFVLAVGIAHCFRRSGGDREFLPRIVAVGLVVSVRTTVLLGIPLQVLAQTLREDTLDPGSVWIGTLYEPLIAAVILWRCGVHLGELAGRGHAAR